MGKNLGGNMKPVTVWSFSLLAGLAAGCATAHIEATRDPSLNVKLHRIYVLVEHGSVKSDYDTLLRTDISELLTKEGVENQTEAISPLELDEKAYLAHITAYGADAVLVIKVAGGTRS